MAVKNYPMNIKILAKLNFSLLKLVYEYDKVNFPNDPAYRQVKNFEETSKYLESIINSKDIKEEESTKD